jgi:NAD(P)-dependent dehydrogenase (short-subunit alcohol dehydrogenase family)
MDRFRNKVVAVTGAASGIGKAIAVAFARRGADLALADIDAEGLERVRKELVNHGIKAYAQAVDVSDASQVEDFCENVYREWGRVDVLVNNAGVSVGGRFQDITLQDWEWIMGVNLRGVINGCRSFYPRMVGQGGGHIVNVASGLALAPLPGSVPYCTTKYGVVGFSETLRAEAALHGVGVTVVCPGFILTNIFRSSRQRTLVPGDTHEASVARTESLLARRRYDAERVAEKVVEAVEKNRGVVPICWEVRLGDIFHRLNRGLYAKALAYLTRAWYGKLGDGGCA